MVFNRALAVTVVFLAALVNAETYTGKIQLGVGWGDKNLFVSNTASGVFCVTNQTGEALQVSITTNSKGPSDLVITNSKFSGASNLGGKGSDLGFGSEKVASLTNVNPTTPGSPPDGSQSESAIWTYTNGQLKAHWVNTDGTTPDTFFTWDGVVGNSPLFISGDVVQYNTVFKDKPAFPVFFTIV